MLGFTRGATNLRVEWLRVGDLLIADSQQFNSTNVVEIIATNRWPHKPGDICYGRWYGRPGNPDGFAIWHWELMEGGYYRALRYGVPVNIVDDAKKTASNMLKLEQLHHEAKQRLGTTQKLVFHEDELFK